MTILMTSVRILIAPFIFLVGAGMAFLIFSLGGFLAPFVALAYWLRPISDCYWADQKKQDIYEALTVFAMCFIIPFSFTWQWITEGKLFDEI